MTKKHESITGNRWLKGCWTLNSTLLNRLSVSGKAAIRRLLLLHDAWRGRATFVLGISLSWIPKVFRRWDASTWMHPSSNAINAPHLKPPDGCSKAASCKNAVWTTTKTRLLGSNRVHWEVWNEKNFRGREKPSGWLVFSLGTPWSQSWRTAPKCGAEDRRTTRRGWANKNDGLRHPLEKLWNYIRKMNKYEQVI